MNYIIQENLWIGIYRQVQNILGPDRLELIIFDITE